MSASSLMPKNVTNLEIVEEPSFDDYVELVNQQRLILIDRLKSNRMRRSTKRWLYSNDTLKISVFLADDSVRKMVDYLKEPSSRNMFPVIQQISPNSIIWAGLGTLQLA